MGKTAPFIKNQTFWFCGCRWGFRQGCSWGCDNSVSTKRKKYFFWHDQASLFNVNECGDSACYLHIHIITACGTDMITYNITQY